MATPEYNDSHTTIPIPKREYIPIRKFPFSYGEHVIIKSNNGQEQKAIYLGGKWGEKDLFQLPNGDFCNHKGELLNFNPKKQQPITKEQRINTVFTVVPEIFITEGGFVEIIQSENPYKEIIVRAGKEVLYFYVAPAIIGHFGGKILSNIPFEKLKKGGDIGGGYIIKTVKDINGKDIRIIDKKTIVQINNFEKKTLYSPVITTDTVKAALANRGLTIKKTASIIDGKEELLKETYQIQMTNELLKPYYTKHGGGNFLNFYVTTPKGGGIPTFTFSGLNTLHKGRQSGDWKIYFDTFESFVPKGAKIMTAIQTKPWVNKILMERKYSPILNDDLIKLGFIKPFMTKIDQKNKIIYHTAEEGGDFMKDHTSRWKENGYTLIHKTETEIKNIKIYKILENGEKKEAEIIYTNCKYTKNK